MVLMMPFLSHALESKRIVNPFYYRVFPLVCPFSFQTVSINGPEVVNELRNADRKVSGVTVCNSTFGVGDLGLNLHFLFHFAFNPSHAQI